MGFSRVFIKYQPIGRVIKNSVSLVSNYQLIKRMFTPVNTMNIPGVAGLEINL